MPELWNLLQGPYAVAAVCLGLSWVLIIVSAICAYAGRQGAGEAIGAAAGFIAIALMATL